MKAIDDIFNVIKLVETAKEP